MFSMDTLDPIGFFQENDTAAMIAEFASVATAIAQAVPGFAGITLEVSKFQTSIDLLNNPAASQEVKLVAAVQAWTLWCQINMLEVQMDLLFLSENEGTVPELWVNTLPARSYAITFPEDRVEELFEKFSGKKLLFKELSTGKLYAHRSMMKAVINTIETGAEEFGSLDERLLPRHAKYELV